ncbi:MAG: mannose-1-phosphate guanylyltransferase/mannose-6-phosphate isomerase [Deltaproteobacteria bacterium]|nr:mannose-1-phosphate guanylyltransferase/mannose-6-phosphate isomerase [Deltaproteobacteria bacterium]
MSALLPVILCGGSGTRLWPLSRRLYPKQFMDISGSTLFGECLQRALALPEVRECLVLCNEEQRFLAAAEVQRIGAPARCLLEPEGRNTAPAVTLAALAASEGGQDPVLLVLPSDHRIEPQSAFAEAVAAAEVHARLGYLACFGAPPDRPETGFGYIQCGSAMHPGFRVGRFVEKPPIERAKQMLEQGNCFWNSGMFAFKSSRWLEEVERYAPAIAAACRAAWRKHERSPDFTRVDRPAFLASPSDSIDYAVMEHTQDAVVVSLDAQWNDLGSWEAFYAVSPKDANGNAIYGDIVAEEARNCYLHAEHRLVAALGVEDLTVVESADAVLVAHRSRHQAVKSLLEHLKSRGRAECDLHRLVRRPWGSYETLALDEEHGRFQVKRIEVKPGASLSLQYHHHRAEHWVVVRGAAKVTVGDKEVLLSENESTYIPVGERHRLENPGLLPLVMVEVQSGSYLGEDDIVRLEDTYGRLAP